jgi:hypothetical protein
MRVLLISMFLLMPFLNGNVLTSLHAAKDDCAKSKQRAIADLKNGKVEFLLQGGFAPVHVKDQEVFEKKYGLHYRDFGCMVPKGICLDIYNREVGQYLDKKHGKAWRKEVRKDVQGL